MAEHIENTDNYPGSPVHRTGKGHVTKEQEYKKGSLPETDKYVLQKDPKVNPRVSTPSETKEEAEPGGHSPARGQ